MHDLSESIAFGYAMMIIFSILGLILEYPAHQKTIVLKTLQPTIWIEVINSYFKSSLVHGVNL